MPLDERPESVSEQTETRDAAPLAGTPNGSASGNGTASPNGSGSPNGTTAATSTVAADDSAAGVSAAEGPERAAGASRGWLDKRTQLAFASFLMLFVELALIRWTAANNVYVTNATNFVLLASFLGIGIGFLNAKSNRDFVRWAPLALVLLVAFVLAFPVILATLAGPHPYQGLFGTQALPRPVSLAVIFVLSTAVMAGFGQAVARLFVTFEPLKAYRLDIFGSIAGTAAFTLMSFLELPPVAWGVIVAGGLVLLLGRSARWWQYAAAVVVVAMLAVESAVPHQQWSPYYKISAQLSGKAHPALYVSANNIPYQAARSLTVLHQQKKFYFYPYQHVTRSSLKNVLIVGAGTGNDVAVALSEGAQHVDAVEIDPVLIKLGSSQHPNHPYDSPRVTTHNTDGRAFLQNTKKNYNLILFALPDSLTAVNGQSNLRLESYLLTEQSVQSARAHLAPGGTMSMYNYYSNHLYNRYATTMLDAFGQAPCSQVGAPLGGRRLAVLTDKPAGETVPNCTNVWRGTAGRPGHRRPPVPVPAEQHHPHLVRVDAGADPRRLALARPALRQSLVPQDGRVHRPGLHGRGVPAAGNEEHRPVRAAVRQYLAGQRAGDGGHPDRGVPGGGNGPAREAAPAGGALRRADRLPGADLADPAGRPGQPAHRRAVPGRRGAGLRPGVHREPDLRAAVQRRGDHDHRVRRQPARRHGRRGPGVPGPDHRLPVPADPGGRAVRAGLRVPDASPPGRVQAADRPGLRRPE